MSDHEVSVCLLFQKPNADETLLSLLEDSFCLCSYFSSTSIGEITAAALLFVVCCRDGDEEKESSLVEEECILRSNDVEENVFVVAAGWIGIHWERELSTLRSDDGDDEDNVDNGIFFVTANQIIKMIIIRHI